MDEIIRGRKFMQSPKFGEVMSASDQSKGIEHPPHSKEAVGEVVELPAFDGVITRDSYAELLDIRRSERVYSQTAMTQEQLAFMLWSMQGIQKYRAENRVAVLRPVASAGCRHPFELYAAVRDVVGLKPGLYRYAPMLNVGEKKVSLEYIKPLEDYDALVTRMLAGQAFAAKAPVMLFLTCVPYRGEWRYVEASHRAMLVDLGHVGQNAMLSAAALGLGSCCFGAYDQQLCDEVLGADGIDEYMVYGVSVGAVATR